jgi:enoyl-CoA hydratase/carnithine racemase
MDLVSLQNREDMDSVREALNNYVKACTSIFESDKPVIALVQGEVKAGGVGLACCCDVVLATPNSSFELGEVLFGLLPANVLPFILGNRVSLQKARYMVLTSKKIAAEEALRIGLIDEIFPAEKLERGVKNLIKRFLRSSPRALAEGKQFTLEIAHKIPKDVRDTAKEQLLSLIESQEAHKAIAAFNAGDLPAWFSSFKPEHPLVHPMEEEQNE